MNKFLSLIILLVLSKTSTSQNSFSFNCKKDIIIECTTACLTLTTILPDIHSATNSYTVNKVSGYSCFRGYVSPAAPAATANLLIDDRYSPPINIGFPFSFFGASYSTLIASTNGFLSFDIAKTGTFSHFGILKNGATLSATAGTPQDLPNTLFDKALIMGPYHDLDPNISLATQQIKYEVIGTAPYRKWIISYYNVPLYTTACLNLNKNTHQIVLYETLGIVEIFIYDKEICLNWNNGKAIIGMQDITKSAAIMAPGRSASDVPWGTQSMNESWRFAPASGKSLFKKVELYTQSGTFVTNGNVTNSGNDLLGVTFPNICPPSAGETYLVKSYYEHPTNPGEEVIGLDTIHISRGDPITTNIVSAPCAAGSNGSITVITPVGPTYEYSLDGINWQASTVFKVPAASYLLRSRIIGSSCISSSSLFVGQESFSASIIKTINPCPGPLSAMIEIVPRYGNPQYNYSLNNGPFQTSNVFTNLSVGTYKVMVTDASGCSYNTEVKIDTMNLAEAVITNTICGRPGSGTITVTPGFGLDPYTYTLNGGTSRPTNVSQSSNVFKNLDAGNYTITVKDSTGCTYSFQAQVSSDASFFINPAIQMPLCNGDKNATLSLHPTLGPKPYQFALNTDPYQADSVYKNLGAGNYTIHIKDSLGCIKDTVITIQQPNPVSGTIIITPAANCFSVDGEINVKANGGVIPFMYSINNGTTFEVSNVYTRPAGVFSIVIKDSNNCKTTITDTVHALDDTIDIDLGPDKSICVGSSTTLSLSSSKPLSVFRWTPYRALNDSTTAKPVVSPTDTTTYFVTAGTGVCSGKDSITVNVLHKPVAHAGNDTIICNKSYAVLKGSVTDASGSVSYLWLPSADMLTPTSATTILYPKNTRPNIYRLQVKDNYGCNFVSTDEVRVRMNEPVPAFAGNDTIASLGLPHQLLGSGGSEYLWSPIHFFNDPRAQNPTVVLQNDMTFYLTVTDNFGCVGTSSVFVRAFKGPTYYIPNAFTPNSDGINDVFKAIAPGIKQTFYFKVFNRFGQLMFNTQNISYGWDGNFKGVAQPTAVYVWIIKGLDITGKTVEMKGTVTLIR